MHPTIGYQLAIALITERHHNAEHDRAARAARQASRAHVEHSRRPLVNRAAAVLARHARLARRRMA